MNMQASEREILHDSLVRTFLRFGYDGASVRLLAAASGLSKASLYHHFPHGKPAMIAVLARNQISQLQRLAFVHLQQNSHQPLADLSLLCQGFGAYFQEHNGRCLLIALTQQHSTNPEELAPTQNLIRDQFDDWTAQLTHYFERVGRKHKRAQRESQELLATIYGACAMGRLLEDPNHVQKSLRRLEKSFRMAAQKTATKSR